MREAVLVSAVRTAVARAPKGALATTRPDDFAAAALSGALARVPALASKEIDDIILGCAQPEGEQGWDIARWVALRAGLPVTVPGLTINRLCASGLEAIATAAAKIESGNATTIAAGGVESMSILPFGGLKPAPNPWFVANYPAALTTMGLTAERVAKRYQISREAQDEFALLSHQRALAAQAAGKFTGEIIPLTLSTATPNLDPAKPSAQGRAKLAVTESTFSIDEGPRADSTAEALAALKPAFAAKGTVTAGNSSQTSDGAAISILMELKQAEALGLKPLGRLIAYSTAGCLPEEMGIGPIYAIPKALKKAGLELSDIDVIELNEAFASQALAVIRTLGLDPERVNPNGGAIALGHPLGCTGAKLTASLFAELSRRNARYGMVTMCVGGGMGAAGIYERY